MPPPRVFCRLLILSTILTATVAASGPATFHLDILHNNDLHGYFHETAQHGGICYSRPCYGGISRAVTIVKKARDLEATGHGPQLLVFNAGDNFIGSYLFELFKADVATDAINAYAPDALAIGNHDFDANITTFTHFVARTHAPFLCANINFTRETLDILPSIIVQKNATKIGVIGYTVPGFETGEMKALGISVTDPIVAVRKESERLHGQGVNIIVALGHGGYENEKKMARDVPLVDVIVGAHSHTFLYTGVAPDIESPQGPYPTVVVQKSGKKVPVVQAYKYGKYLGHLSLTFDHNGELITSQGNPILLDETIPEDPETLKTLVKYKPAFDRAKKTILGHTKVTLDGTCMHLRECNMGNLITDAMVWFRSINYMGRFWTDSPLAIVSAIIFRNSIALNASGNVTKADLYSSVMPQERLIVATMNGQTLLAILADAVDEISIQVSGLHLIYDNGRLVEARARCGNCDTPHYVEVTKNETYRVLTSNALFEEPHNYKRLLPEIHLDVENVTVVQVVEEYLKVNDPIYPQTENRIVVRGRNESEDASGSGRLIAHGWVFVCFLVLFIGEF